jgi:hypothetical protein
VTEKGKGLPEIMMMAYQWLEKTPRFPLLPSPPSLQLPPSGAKKKKILSRGNLRWARSPESS